MTHSPGSETPLSIASYKASAAPVWHLQLDGDLQAAQHEQRRDPGHLSHRESWKWQPQHCNWRSSEVCHCRQKLQTHLSYGPGCNGVFPEAAGSRRCILTMLSILQLCVPPLISKEDGWRTIKPTLDHRWTAWCLPEEQWAAAPTEEAHTD